MELLVVLLFIVLLFVILSFKRTVSSNIEKLSHDIWLLKEELTKISRGTITTESKTPPAAATPAAEIKKERTYWETSFKPAEEHPAAVPKNPEPKPAETVLPAQPAITEIKEVVALPAQKPVQHEPPTPGFFERHPDLEKFIGENLINKIGIAILVLAIGFFVKYAIDNNWIGPVGRVGIGIACGGILVGLAHRLRTNYKGFSSVLAGGGLAIFYFTITLAFHQFHLFDQLTSFIIMIVITAFAVLLSILYNRQELAVIALAGGFATPFMVSNGSGNYQVLFTYLLVLNTGLLVIAYYKSWRLLNILSFLFTVLLFGGWLLSLKTNIPPDTYRNGLVFATAFYLLFFIINIAHNIKENKQFIASDFGILLLNTSVYFAAGLYLITAMHAANYRGLFSASMGIFNLGASFMLFRKKQADRNILYLLIGITLTFVSLTAPLQLHGNYITLFWSSEAVLLYWLYQRSSIGVIRYSSFIIWVAMVVSLLMDWFQVYYGHSALTIIANKGFITGIYAAAASIILFLLIKKESTTVKDSRLITRNDRVFSVAGLVILFSSGLLEINYQFLYYFPQTGINLQYILLYTYLFVLLHNLLVNKFTRLNIPGKYSSILIGCCLILYLICIQDGFSLLRQLINEKRYLAHFSAHWLGSTVLALLFFILTRHLRRQQAYSINNPVISWVLCSWVVIFLSTESYLLNYQLSYKTGSDWHETGNIFQKTILPILWGLCSFAFMWLGMRYKFRTLRIISLALFSITLVKLFVFDIRNIPAGGKIAAFFCLGVLLLVVSFMYQRLKRIIIEDEKKREA